MIFIMAGCRRLPSLVLSVIFFQFSGMCSSNIAFTRKLSSAFLCPPEKNSTGDKDCPREVNDCPNANSMLNFIHTKAVGENDTIHYIISSFGVPSILMAKTNNHVNLTVDWEKYLSKDVKTIENSISFSHEPEYVTTLLLKNLIDYNDINDTAKLSDVTENGINIIDLSGVQWLNCSESSNLTSHTFKLQFQPSTPHENSSFTVLVELFGDEGRNAELPHLEYSANISHITVTMDNLPTDFNNSRFALEAVLISTDEHHNLTAINSSKSLDDEHSPGVFKMVDWTSQGKHQTTGTFLQWKPVAYIGRMRNLTVATKVANGNLATISFHNSSIKPSVALGYFGTELYKDMLLICGTNISFGVPGDNFYVGYNYTLWAFSMGLGTPPSDEVSLLIILVISIGLGIPVILIIVGGLGICFKKQKHENQGYQDIATDYSAIQ